MVSFLFLGFYVMPLFAFLFIVTLLRAIRNIVKDKPYTKELFWSGILFAIITWTITVVTIFSNES